MDDTGEQTLRERAYESFTHHLLSRDVRPGQFISQRRLVELTGLPLGAIREAIPRLEAEGLIKTVPQRGLQVAHIDINLIREAFQFRIFLEKEAVALFTRSASDAAIAKLLKQHRDIAEAAENGGESPELEQHDHLECLPGQLHQDAPHQSGALSHRRPCEVGHEGTSRHSRSHREAIRGRRRGTADRPYPQRKGQGAGGLRQIRRDKEGLRRPCRE